MTDGRRMPLRIARGTGWTFTVAAVVAVFVGAVVMMIAAPAAFSASGVGAPAAPAARSGSHAFAWGLNVRGALGTGSTAATARPVPVVLPAGVVAVDLGQDHALDVTATGQVFAWGDDRYGQLGTGHLSGLEVLPHAVALPKRALRVAAGDEYSVTLLSDGSVYSWGRNDAGQLGRTTTGASGTRGLVHLPGPAVDIAAGARHALAVTATGQLFGWGGNERGQLGSAAGRTGVAPTAILLPGHRRALKVAAGRQQSVVLATDGSVWQWGGTVQSSTGSMATRVATPAHLRVVDLAAGDRFTVALTATGQVLTWGDNRRGELGDGSQIASQNVRTVQFPRPATSVAAGAEHVIARTANGAVYSWGDNSYGELGSAATTASAPQPIASLAGAKVSAIAAGGRSSLAVVTVGPLASLRVTPALATVGLNTGQMFHARGIDAFGDDLGPVAATWTIDGNGCAGNRCVATQPGRHEVTAAAGRALGFAQLVVRPGGTSTPPPSTATTTPSPTTTSTVSTMSSPSPTRTTSLTPSSQPPRTRTTSSTAATVTSSLTTSTQPSTAVTRYRSSPGGSTALETGSAAAGPIGVTTASGLGNPMLPGSGSLAAPGGSGLLGYTGLSRWLLPTGAVVLGAGLLLNFAGSRRRRRPVSEPPEGPS